MNDTQTQALKIVLELAEQNALNPKDAETEELQMEAIVHEDAIHQVRRMLEKVDVNPEPQPLIDSVKGPLTVEEFCKQTKQTERKLGHVHLVNGDKIQFHRRGSGPYTVSNPNGTFIVGDFVTVTRAGLTSTYSITS